MGKASANYLMGNCAEYWYFRKQSQGRAFQKGVFLVRTLEQSEGDTIQCIRWFLVAWCFPRCSFLGLSINLLKHLFDECFISSGNGNVL